MKNDFLEGGAAVALMSGSGASVFGIFKNRADAEKTAEKIAKNARFVAVTEFFAGFFV